MNIKYIDRLHPNSIVSLIITTDNDNEIVENILLDYLVLLKELPNFEILVIDNASDDNTTENIKRIQKKNPQIRLLVLSKRYDPETLIAAGLDNCIGDYVLTVNKYTDRIQAVKKVMEKLLEGYDIVFGKLPRTNVLIKNRVSRLIISLFEKIYPHNILSGVNYLAGFSRKAVNSITRVRRKKRRYDYIKKFVGYKTAHIVYSPNEKYLDKIKQLGLLPLIVRAVDASISNSVRPLRLASIVGITAATLNLLFLLYVFIVTLIKNDIAEGWITTSVIMGSMFFLLFSVLVVVSEYILRILDETRQEPLYFISEETDHSIFSYNKDKLNVV